MSDECQHQPWCQMLKPVPPGWPALFGTAFTCNCHDHGPAIDDLIEAASRAIEAAPKAGRWSYPQIGGPFGPVPDQVTVTYVAVSPEQAALIRAGRECRVYWGTHGCNLERGHDGNCLCDCDCVNHPDSDSGCVCAYPYYGHKTNFYGEDFADRGLPTFDDGNEHPWRAAAP